MGTRLHSICIFRQRLDNQILVLLPPSPHPLVGVNKRRDIVRNIFLLSTFVMTDVEVWKVKADKFLYQLDDLFSLLWHGRLNCRLIKSIHNDGGLSPSLI